MFNQLSAHIFSLFIDPTIYFSFDKTGYHIHKKYFNPKDTNVDLSDKIAIVTGANSGIGFQTCKHLALKGAHVYMLCRNKEKAQKAHDKIKQIKPNAKLSILITDLSKQKDILKFINSFPENKLDILVNNAGILPHEKVTTDDGYEQTLAVNLIAPYLLTSGLIDKLKKAPHARVVNVSSGGMYTQQLNMNKLIGHVDSFDGVIAYAQTKRALVILNDYWAQHFNYTSITFNAMHPGWASTPGVSQSLPKFHQTMKKKLRTPYQGADTIIWLACYERLQKQSGYFFFDRKKRLKHYLPWTRSSQEDREDLINFLLSLD